MYFTNNYMFRYVLGVLMDIIHAVGIVIFLFGWKYMPDEYLTSLLIFVIHVPIAQASLNGRCWFTELTKWVRADKSPDTQFIHGFINEYMFPISLHHVDWLSYSVYLVIIPLTLMRYMK